VGNIIESFLLKNFGDIGKYGDIGTFGDMGTEIEFFVQKNEKRVEFGDLGKFGDIGSAISPPTVLHFGMYSFFLNYYYGYK
jgi:hypothetical protein